MLSGFSALLMYYLYKDYFNNKAGYTNKKEIASAAMKKHIEDSKGRESAYEEGL